MLPLAIQLIVDNVAHAREYAGVSLGRVCIGSCTNGRIEDMRIAAQVLAGKKAAAGMRLVVYPASRSVLLQAISEGVISVLVEAGAAVCAPGCGFCIGRTVALGDGEVVLSTQNGKQQRGDLFVVGRDRGCERDVCGGDRRR